MCNGLLILVPFFFSSLHHPNNKYFCEPFQLKHYLKLGDLAVRPWGPCSPGLYMLVREGSQQPIQKQTDISAKTKLKQEVVVTGGARLVLSSTATSWVCTMKQLQTGHSPAVRALLKLPWHWEDPASRPPVSLQNEASVLIVYDFFD